MPTTSSLWWRSSSASSSSQWCCPLHSSSWYAATPPHALRYATLPPPTLRLARTTRYRSSRQFNSCHFLQLRSALDTNSEHHVQATAGGLEKFHTTSCITVLCVCSFLLEYKHSLKEGFYP